MIKVSDVFFSLCSYYQVLSEWYLINNKPYLKN